ncbi:MAG TPA: DUF4965 domain-containing protein [Tepidisphaeraceae bacterium]|jgi:hypothetical protein|nr:DUF4965 domain-containing protein [Tepidisphaeraceae bacterium]
MTTLQAYAGPSDQPNGRPSFRPPAVPLVTTDPYFSIWSFNDRLTDADTHHWTGKPNTLISLIRIDGKPYRLAGNQPANVPALEQTGLQVLPTRTIYTFTGAGITLTLTFTTPMLPDDLDILSRPLTYVTWQASPTDGKSHEITAMLAIGGDVAVNTPDESVIAKRTTAGPLTALQLGTEAQPILRSKGDDHRIDWGYLYLTAPDPASLSIANLATLTQSFADNGTLPAADDSHFPRPVHDGLPSLAVTLDLSQGSPRHAILAYDDLYSIQFMGKNLRPYWRRNGMDASALLQAGEKDYADLTDRCAKFDTELLADAENAGGDDYAQICALAYRQSLAAQKVVADANGMPLSFSKENFSNGCIATVDVFYPQLPQFLLLSPTLAKAAVTPLLEYASSDRWKFDFAPHDLGTYPQANGQVYGGGERTADNQMPVEECGNLLSLVAAIAKADGNADLAANYWPTLTKWEKYLEENGFNPEKQLCTDDFAGHLAHNTNLSIKAIMGLGSYAMLADLRGDSAEAARVRTIAKDLASRWVTMADDGDHFRLTFDRPGTWSQKYNLVWDKVLGFGIFPKEVASKEIAFYLTKQNKYGLPLDSRKTYTKLDWITWTATLADRKEDFAALVKPIRKFLNESPTRVPMTDWYDTVTGIKSGFQARPVVGGVFIKLLTDDAVWKKWTSRSQKVTGQYAPIPVRPTVEIIEPGSKPDGVIWRYTTSRPPEGWMKPSFNDHNWKQGPGGFGTPGTPGAIVRTRWDTDDIYVRREITIPAGVDLSTLQLYVHHDEDADIYFNGVLAAKLAGFTADYDVVEMLPAAQAALHPGKNLLAVHCHQTTGGQYIDVGLARLK